MNAVVCILALACCQPLLAEEPSVPVSQTVEILGRVNAIETAPLKNSRLNWLVIVEPERVISGQFTGRSFSFRVHSPSKARLVVGKRFRIRAIMQNGYYSAKELDIKAAE